ncbi:GNAT family N-acetyltransferase [Photobacterium proteolyticum]|uniref:GNAT family N-acetyltransferase n=1 Tax=Photobacterium proteolyticum TaxID=1903952 RepID=A0A1Q9GS85_9GAMM|nr:GNAT family N-acetyltransferase [Photobacterium proteolyticum]OLQ77582.1 GNAT family N-acetyltransferase [Photobacterium proteolyticum]
MSKLRFHPLEPLRFPLINRFYKSYYPAGKAKKDEVIWVGEDNSSIICCVRFKQFDNYQLLTGMLVHPEQRGMGLTKQLLTGCYQQLIETPCYCFAFAHLETLYQGANFIALPESELPEPLLSRLRRYRQSGKKLVAMRYQP